ncbi:MAG TPA: envelope stress response membrane protein PspC [Stellaceae bacterium]|nr:envelope stress response membrane protein PspC [Stellaceae bacterium]
MAWMDNNQRFRLWRDRDRGILAGVCAGIADYLGIEPIVTRIVAVAGLIFFPFPTLVAYLILAVALRPKPPALYQSRDDEAFWRGVNAAPTDTFQSLRHKFRDLEERLRRMESQVTSADFDLHRKFHDLGR